MAFWLEFKASLVALCLSQSSRNREAPFGSQDKKSTSLSLAPVSRALELIHVARIFGSLQQIQDYLTATLARSLL